MLAYWLMPVLGALIGYITNVIAIKSLFRPYQPRRIICWTVQGLLPRHKENLAYSIGKTMEKEVLTRAAMERHWHQMELEKQVEKAFRDYLAEKARKTIILAPDYIREPFIQGMENLFKKDIHKALCKVKESLADHLLTESRLGELVTEEILNLDMKEVEKLVIKLGGRELRYVEVAGGVLGFLVGFIQMLIFVFLRNI